MISRALVLSLPFMAVLAVISLPDTWPGISTPVWLSLGYVSVFSMLVGFVFWYRGHKEVCINWCGDASAQTIAHKLLYGQGMRR